MLWGERRLLLGCEDGSIPVFSLPAFKLGLSIKTHSKLIQCLALSPPLGGEGEREWLATASNEPAVHIVELGVLRGEGVQCVVSPKLKLEGHTSTVCSPHT